MTRQIGILVVDDEAVWRSNLTAILAKAGFRVETASTYQAALDKMTENFYHIITLDIRLTDHDESSEEGMMLLKDLEDRNLFGASEIIMLSAYGTKEQMRQAFRQYGVADFVSKYDFRGAEFVNLIDQVIVEQVRCNPALEIQWQDMDSVNKATAKLVVGGLSTRSSAGFHNRVTSELDDLLCRLFYQAERIVVRPLVDNTSFGTLWVQPIYGGQFGSPAIVTYGGFGEIARHYDNYKRHIEPYQRVGAGMVTISELRRTALLGGLVHNLLYVSIEHLQTFSDFYHEKEISQIRTILDDLFRDLGEMHYQYRSQIKLHDLGAYYRDHLDLSMSSIQEDTAALISPSALSSPGEAATIWDIIDLRVQLALIDRQNHKRSTYFSKIHGDLQPDHIFVDDGGNAHLIGYASVGDGHILCDIATLDSAVRLILLGSDEATLSECMIMERVLSKVYRFEQLEEASMLFHSNNPAVNKAFDTAVHLRTLARRLTLKYGTSGIKLSEYYIASLYLALHVAQNGDLPLTKRRHALGSAMCYFDAIDQVYQTSVDHLESEITRLSHLNQSKFEYLRNASHELGRPLGHSKAILEYYMAGVYDGLISDLQRKALEDALESLNDEFKLIKQMFDLTAMEAGIVGMSRVPTNALDCVRAAIQDNRSFLNAKGLSLAEYLPAQGIEIVGDHLFIQMALSNLLHNAIKFTEHGTVTVSCRQDDSWVRISIKDTGIGIPHELLELIWQPYYQVDRSLARQYQGLGAGLHLAKAWIEQNDGAIHVESHVGEGSTFVVSLPLRSIGK